jgi:ubiquinone/menaquinone biosynthesis C-methylase UbiE/pimeloyl-ACP methyl ester carboxylesterase
MHSFARHRHTSAGKRSTKELVLKGGWRYDLMGWFHDTFSFRGQWRELRQRTATLARIQPGEQVLDVGCGTGTLAIEVQRRVGRAGHVAGIDPGTQQIARARAKAARRNLSIDFQIGVIEQLPFPDQTFDVVLSTLMMHHLPGSLKRQGLSEIARVLKPGGRLVIADFKRKQERQGQAARFHAGGSSMQELATMVSEVETEEIRPPRFSAFPGVGFVRAYKSLDECVQAWRKTLTGFCAKRERKEDSMFQQSHTLKVPGAQLFYEISGNGPLLILIPGARGDGESFRPLAHHLSAQYQVVTYDRRGFSRSYLDGPQDYDRRLATDADDVRRMIEHLTDQPAIVFGSSSGAIVALEVLTQSPERVQTVVAHEPPVVSLLPDAAKWWAFFDRIYDSSRKNGIPKAMHQFVSMVVGKEEHQVIERAMTQQANEYTKSNAGYWMEHELRQYPRIELDLVVLAAHARQILLVGGRDAQDKVSYQSSKALARQLGLNIVDLPGGHLGFMTSPAEFAKELMNALGGGSL